MSDINDPGPTRTWVFVDEREDSINNGFFVVDMTGYPDQPGQHRLANTPASYHNRAATLSFADGHSEIKVWKDPRTFPPLTMVRGGKVRGSFHTLISECPSAKDKVAARL